MTKFKVTDDIVEIIGHSKSVEECNSITNIANALKNSPLFIAQEVRQGYARFQSVKYNEEKLFVPGGGSITVSVGAGLGTVSTADDGLYTTLIATPSSGYTFSHWVVCAENEYAGGIIKNGYSNYSGGNTSYVGGSYVYENTQGISVGVQDGNGADTNFAAVFTEVVTGYNVTYIENGGTPTQTDLTEQSALPNPLPTIAKANFIFGGWYTNEALTTQAVAGATISADATLYAKWTFDGIEINATGGSVILATAGKYCDKNIRVKANLSTLNAPTISLSGSTLTITNPSTNGNFVTGYKVYSGDTLIASPTSTSTTVDLSNYITASGTHVITVKAMGTSFNDSVASSSVNYVISSSKTVTLADSVISKLTTSDYADLDEILISKNGVAQTGTFTVEEGDVLLFNSSVMDEEYGSYNEWTINYNGNIMAEDANSTPSGAAELTYTFGATSIYSPYVSGNVTADPTKDLNVSFGTNGLYITEV